MWPYQDLTMIDPTTKRADCIQDWEMISVVSTQTMLEFNWTGHMKVQKVHGAPP